MIPDGTHIRRGRPSQDFARHAKCGDLEARQVLNTVRRHLGTWCLRLWWFLRSARCSYCAAPIVFISHRCDHNVLAQRADVNVDRYRRRGSSSPPTAIILLFLPNHREHRPSDFPSTRGSPGRAMTLTAGAGKALSRAALSQATRVQRDVPTQWLAHLGQHTLISSHLLPCGNTAENAHTRRYISRMGLERRNPLAIVTTVHSYSLPHAFGLVCRAWDDFAGGFEEVVGV